MLLQSYKDGVVLQVRTWNRTLCCAKYLKALHKQSVPTPEIEASSEMGTMCVSLKFYLLLKTTNISHFVFQLYHIQQDGGGTRGKRLRKCGALYTAKKA